MAPGPPPGDGDVDELPVEVEPGDLVLAGALGEDVGLFELPAGRRLLHRHPVHRVHGLTEGRARSELCGGRERQRESTEREDSHSVNTT